MQQLPQETNCAHGLDERMVFLENRMLNRILVPNLGLIYSFYVLRF